jgi:hypothetical protein
MHTHTQMRGSAFPLANRQRQSALSCSEIGGFGLALRVDIGEMGARPGLIHHFPRSLAEPLARMGNLFRIHA